jgi:hypothetical protein
VPRLLEVATPNAVTMTSPITVATVGAGYTNAWRGRHTPPPVFEYVDSRGRAGTADNRPSVYVSGSNERARSLRHARPGNHHTSHKSLALSRSSSISSSDGFAWSP